MTKYTATFTGAYTDKYDARYTELFYNYRGFNYSVTKANNWSSCSSDYLSGGYMSLVNQHKRAQAAIDKSLACPDIQPSKEEIARAQAETEAALDMLYWDWE